MADSWAGSALNLALFDDNTDLALELLAAKADAHAQCAHDGREAIHFAAQHGDETVLRTLLAMGVDINKPDNSGETPLWSARDYFRPIMQALGAHEHGSRLNDAISGDETELALSLLRAGADPLARSPLNTNQAIHFAAEERNEEIIHELLKLGVSINTRNRRGQRPIDLVSPRFAVTLYELGSEPLHGSLLNDALAWRDSKRAIELINSGTVDLHARSSTGSLCTHFAVQAGCADILWLLVDRGVSINERNWKEQQVDAFASSAGMRAKIAKIRKLQLSMLRAKDRKQAEQMAEAAKLGAQLCDALLKHDIKRALQLLKQGADPRYEDSELGQPIHCAAKAGHEGALRALLNCGVSINTPNRLGQRPIHFAKPKFAAFMRKLGVNRHGSALNDALAVGDWEEATELVKDSSIDLWARSPVDGDFCVHFAAQQGFADILQRVVDRGVSIFARNFNGRRVDGIPGLSHAVRETIAKLRQRVKDRRAELAAWVTEGNARLRLPLPVMRIALAYWHGD